VYDQQEETSVNQQTAVKQPDTIWERITARFGTCPSLFRVAPDAPQITQALWDHAQAAYLDNPLPSLFKERLFVYLSRFCETRYCVARHFGFLIGLGRPAGDHRCAPMAVDRAMELLVRPLPARESLDPLIRLLEDHDQPIDEWPAPDSDLDRSLLACAAMVFLSPARARRIVPALERALGPAQFEHLMVLLSFIRTAHFWSEVHPDLELDEDIKALLDEHEGLAEYLLGHREADHSGLGEPLYEELLSLREEHKHIEELRQARRALEEKDRQKDEFIAMLGHELRNPLASIRSAADLLSLTPHEDDLLGQIKEVLRRQTSAMARLLDDLLDVARLALGKIQSELQPVDLVEVVRDSVADRRAHARDQGLEIVLELPDRGLWVEADRVRLAQIIDNLLSNALKFTDAPGTITVAVHEEKGEAVLVVRDTGVGLDPAVREHLFEPFRQGPQDLHRTQGGLGLGLALCKGLVELYGGRIEARSDGFIDSPRRGASQGDASFCRGGPGTEIEIRLPRCDQDEDDTDSQTTPLVRRQRILVVEDNDDAAEMLRYLLQIAGHEVALSQDGPQALELARAIAPDVILCDIGLPGDMNGYDLARAIRAEPALDPCRLVALTGYGSIEDRRMAVEAGFEVHLTKPVGLSDIEHLLLRLQYGS
jgi:signal transduction histidine kinase/ActR/RegA family two-component response regulator